jgi:hypothetical protein
MDWLERLKNVDRRVIFAIIALAVAIPLLKPMGLPLDISSDAQRIFDRVDALPAGSIVMLSFDYDPGSRAEVHPMAKALIHHCFRKGLKIVAPSLWPQGVTLASDLFGELASQYGKVYGEDYVNLGYFYGPTSGLTQVQAIMGNIFTAFPQDVKGTKTSDIPLMKKVTSAKDISLVVTLSAGDPGVPAWVKIANGRYGTIVAGGATAVQTPNFLPYVQGGQMLGILGGLAGAADYEKLVAKPGVATSGMDAQSVAHLVILLFILLSNATYLYERHVLGRGRKMA